MSANIIAGEQSKVVKPAADETVQVPPEILSKIQSLYDNGQCLQAFRAAEPFGPFTLWKEGPARVLAGRLANNLGGYQVARVLQWLAWRTDRRNPDFLAYHGYNMLQRRGPLAVFELLERYGPPPAQATPDGLMHLACLRAIVRAHLRDFSTAQHWLKQAESLCSGHPWMLTTRATVLEMEDRYEEALETAAELLKLRRWFRPGVQAFAHTLQLLDRDEEALQFLSQASERLENMHVTRQLSALQIELGLYVQAGESLDRFEKLAPLIEKPEREWLLRQRVAIDCLRREWKGALDGARQIDDPYYRDLAARLETGANFRQVRLQVPFVRQHHVTCAPATLSAISRFWQRPAEHLEIAEAICYDGTPAHSERHWAETHGWLVREFCVTWPAAVALLDRGIPFTLTTSGPTRGHLQAVIGYDEARQTLWIRDPFFYNSNEFWVKPLLEQQRAVGPRGMAMVPADRPDLLEGLDLPDSEWYDRLYQVERALSQHRRDQALESCRQMQQAAPEHRLTLNARRAIASYDGNTPAMLESLELLLKQFPDSENLLLPKLNCLRELARRGERLELLEKICARPGVDPVFWQQYAQELRMDARQHKVASSWVRWALRFRPGDPFLVGTWADLLWDERKHEPATVYYRIAACLGETNEHFSRNYYLASIHLRRGDEAIEFLKAREARLGKRSGQPVITLVESLQNARSTTEAFAALEAALLRRPDDGDLQLFAADFYGRFGQFQTALQLLQKAQPNCSAAAWHRAAATLDGYRNQKTEALRHWHELLKLEPLAHDAIRAAAHLLAETEGRKPALKFLDDLCERFPFSCPLLTLRIRWVAEDGAEAAIPHIRRLIEVNPADAWAWRELALQLSAASKSDEALAAASEAIRLEPNSPAGYSIRGQVLLNAGRLPDARAEFREALRLDVDNGYALTHFVQTGSSLAERKAALAIIADELRRQVISGEALFAYQDAAKGVLTPQEVLALLKDAHAARPDLSQSWSVLIHQLVHTGDYDAAFQTAKQATERFPLLPTVWVDLARVEQARLDEKSQIAALEKALAINPHFAFASRQLAGIYQRQHALDKARATLEQAIAANPLDALNHGCLAETLWDLGQRDAAIQRAQHALKLEPGYDWAWGALSRWGAETGRPHLAAEMARELTGLRAGEARSWIMLADCLSPETQADELFAAVDKALALNPRAETAYDIRARAMVKLNRFDEALAQCSPPELQPPPANLLIRAAWIETERGNLPKGLALLKAALVEHPENYAGWQLLSDWHLRLDQIDEAAKAAEQMAALAPLTPVPLGFLGDLKLRLQEREAARAAFQRAFTLDPNYKYAGYRLVQMQLEDRQHSQAEETLRILRRGGETHETLAFGVRVELELRGKQAALDTFKKLLQCSHAEMWSINQAASVLDTKGERRAVDKLFEERLAHPECAPAVAGSWVQRKVKAGKWRLHKKLKSLAGETRHFAIFTFFDHLGSSLSAARKKGDLTIPWTLRRHFERVLRDHRDWLAQDVEGWGKVGYVLTCIGRPRPVIEWLGDWRTRPKAESWMLYNLIVMLHRVGRHTEARELVRHAVSLRHGEDFYEVFRTWAAFEEALEGNTAGAARHLASLPGQTKRSELKPLQAMTRLLLSLHEGRPDPKSARKEIRAGLRDAFSTASPSRWTRYVRDAYWRFLEAAQKDFGPQGLWAHWFYRGKDWAKVVGQVLLVLVSFAFPPLLIGLLIYFARRRFARD